MRYNTRNLFQVLAAVVVLAFGANYALAQSTWVGPTASPPGNNAEAPINISATGQTKTGKLTLGGFQLQDGSESSGYVLASDASGNAAWANLTDLLGGGDDSGVPAGAVMHFNLGTCPSGWSEFTDGEGRYIVGMPQGGTLGGMVGYRAYDW